MSSSSNNPRNIWRLEQLGKEEKRGVRRPLALTDVVHTGENLAGNARNALLSWIRTAVRKGKGRR